MSVLPTTKTPVLRCEHKSLHTQAMMRKFQDMVVLNGLADKLAEATSTLLVRQQSYQEKTNALILLRVTVKFVDRRSDQAVRLAQKRAEIEDGKSAGRITNMLFPNGTTPIIKPVGSTQVKEMRALEGRFVEAASIYSAAPEEGKKIEALRIEYEEALDARHKGMEAVAQARAARNLAKEEFLDVFAEIANRIRAAFPRDKQTQELFFLRDRLAEESDGGTEEQEDEAELSGSEG